MDHQEVNGKVRKAFENATPNVLDSVLSHCREQKGTVIVMTEKKKVSIGKKIAAIAAALALIVGLGAGIGVYQISNTAESTVSLDVNPSIQITVNRNEKVLKVESLNADGQTVLSGMDLKGQDIDLAINAIIGSMVRNGYISELANSILISVDSKDPTKGAALQQRLADEISNILKTDGVAGAVIGQTVSTSDDLKELADQHGISVGKAQLIKRIIASDPTYKFEDLAKLSINELKLLSETSHAKVDNIHTVGNASDKRYIGKEDALAAALQHAGLTLEQVTKTFVEMDLDDGVMIYEIEFHYDSFEYEYDIDALSGQVLSFDKEVEHKNDPKPSETPVNPPAEETLITPEEAVAAALQHAKLTKDQIRDLDVDFERKNGVAYYDIDFDAGNTEYDYKVNALDGAILGSEKEVDQDDDRYDDDDDDDDDTPVDTTDVISRDEAKSAALAHAGLSASDISEYECELDLENGKKVYEIEFKSGNTEYSYEIDALTGAVLHSEKEIDD